ncbi:MAG: hypothetical protein SWK90_15260 [Chloroflexota bacterium]|nr:hypothetical protein [Chloroflexota bacterium]
MSERVWFISGRPSVPEGPLARYRPIQPVGAATAYVRTLTRPGDLVVDLFCQGPAVVREAVATGRRALGFSVNPLLLVAARLGLGQREGGALNAAFTRLADSPKGDLPLRHHLASLYRSACPACGASGTAEWFAWDRDENRLLRKAVRCPRCEKVQEGAGDDDDIAAARRPLPRGLAYYYALDRVAPLGHPARERATQLVELYTPRNLSALMDLSLRLAGIEASDEVRLALTDLLLDCFDAGSSLDPYGEERPRPRTLRVPSRYVERNVWLCFEEGLPPLRSGEGGRFPPQATDVAALVRGEEQGYALASRAARDVGQIVPPGSVSLIFADPPRPDGVFWALSALWAGWLWDSPAARAMRPFLRRRRFDWDWHWHVSRVALEAVGPLLAAEGFLVTIFSDPDEALLESVCLAASGAGYALAGWGCDPGVGYRLVWRWEPRRTDRGLRTAALDEETLERDLMVVTEDLAVSALLERGEPAPWSLLHASVYAGLASRRTLVAVAALPDGGPSPLGFAAHAARQALEEAPLVQMEAVVPGGGGVAAASKEVATRPPLWWLADPREAQEPLADRVEMAVLELLRRRVAWDEEELTDAICARFPGPLTPDQVLLHGCIASYSVQEGEMLRLRLEDDPQRRSAELDTLCGDLVELGKRLGFKVRRRGGGWDVRWLEEGRPAYVFAISVTAVLSPRLLAPSSLPSPPHEEGGGGVQRCQVVPGGRAQLVGLKLQRDPRLARAVETNGWQFIKFRHLRRLVAEEELDRHALKTVLGLDPIVEREAAQIPLF